MRRRALAIAAIAAAAFAIAAPVVASTTVNASGGDNKDHSVSVEAAGAGGPGRSGAYFR